MTEKKLIEFPCDFEVKIIGNNTAVFIDEINAITKKHFPDYDVRSTKKNLSQNKAYLGLTVKFHVLNQVDLDNFYREVSSHPEIKMVL